VRSQLLKKDRCVFKQTQVLQVIKILHVKIIHKKYEKNNVKCFIFQIMHSTM